MTAPAASFQIEPINRLLHGAAMQSFMDTVSGELFPENWPVVLLREIPSTDDDVWLAVYNEAGWLTGLIYALKIPGVPGHNLHLVMSKALAARLFLPVLQEAAAELFDTYEIDLICAVIPGRWRHARWLAGAFGFKPDCAGLWFMSRAEFHARYPD